MEGGREAGRPREGGGGIMIFNPNFITTDHENGTKPPEEVMDEGEVRRALARRSNRELWEGTETPVKASFEERQDLLVTKRARLRRRPCGRVGDSLPTHSFLKL